MGDASKFAVFIQGEVRGYDVWFRVELENTKKSKRKMVRERISPVAVLEQKNYGVGGSWEVIGDDIYWIGGWIMDEGCFLVEVSKRLLKHNINSSDIRSWETVSTSMKLPRASPVITAVGENKLYVLLGDDRSPRYDNNIDNDDEEVVVAGDVDWNKCGEIYDIENGTWEYLAPDFERFSEYDPFHTAIVVKDVNNEQPNDIAFFSFHLPVMYFKLAEQTLETPNPSCHLTLNSVPTAPPKGCNDTFPLLCAVNNFKSAFDGNTFYWFAGDMRLYGYDVDCQCWLLSPSLEDKFHHLEYPPYFTMLYALGNGNLLVIVDEPGQPGFFTMATLEVHKVKDEQGPLFLSVSVKSLQALHLDHNQRFRPSCAKAVKLKNTDMRGQQQVTDDVHPLRKMERKIDSRTKAFISMCWCSGNPLA